MTDMTWVNEYQTMLDDCEKRESRMSEWEQSFCDSLSVQLGNGKLPTPKQVETLDRIWEKVTAAG